MTSDKHCKEIKCPKCGGTMRRVERPGPGEDSKAIDDKELPTVTVVPASDSKTLEMGKDDADEGKIIKIELKKRTPEDMAIYFSEKYAELFVKNIELKELNEQLNTINKDLELKAGAVLNAKNKSNLKNAQAQIQTVLDSAGEKESIDDEGGKTKDTKKDDTVITLTKDVIADAGKDEKTEEKTITINEKLIAEAVSKALNYHLGIPGK